MNRKARETVKTILSVATSGSVPTLDELEELGVPENLRSKIRNEARAIAFLSGDGVARGLGRKRANESVPYFAEKFPDDWTPPSTEPDIDFNKLNPLELAKNVRR